MKGTTEMMSGLNSMDRDRISDLPRSILQHILSSLSQIDAVKTCVLSKSWRYLWYGRPNVEFFKDDFRGTVQNFISVLHQTLIRYDNQNLSIQKFILKMPEMILPVSDPFLEKWIPIVMLNNSEVLFRHLQTLRLHHVQIENETFERIMWSCPLIEEVSLIKCEGLNTTKVNNHNCSLKNFEFWSYHNRGDARIEMADLSRIETINFTGCWDWFDHHYKNLFTHLKSLRLSCVNLTTKSVDIFSCNFPCLEELELSNCRGDAFEELQLSSRSIKYFAIDVHDPIKVSNDAPNILKFEYNGYDFPTHISFTTTSNKWKSKIVLTTNWDDSDDIDYISKWLHKLDELLKVFSRSENSLHIRVIRSEDDYHVYGQLTYNIVQVVVKHLELCLGRLCSDYSVWLEREGIPTIEKWNS